MRPQTSLETTVALALQRAETRYAPDDRAAVADVSPSVEDGAVVLRGPVSNDRIRRGLLEAVRELVSEQSVAGAGSRQSAVDSGRVVRDDVTVLADLATPRTTRRRVASIRGEPDDDAEQVTQALYGAELTAYDRRDGWCRVRTADEYLGWVTEDALREPEVDEQWTPDAVVTAVPAALRDGCAVDRVPAGTPCRIVSDENNSAERAELVVTFRPGTEARLSADAVRETRGSTALGTGDDVVSTASQFLETPYEWGGMTTDGIDCSGLVRIAYAAVGVLVPRDADQQRHLGRSVDRAALAPGDLLFFPGHVAISLGGAAFVHASGDAGEVTIDSLDPEDDHYAESLDESMTAAKRLLPERSPNSTESVSAENAEGNR